MGADVASDPFSNDLLNDVIPRLYSNSIIE